MRPKHDLTEVYQILGVSEIGQQLVERIRNSQPTRRVQGGRGNVCVRFPSQKMGCVIQCESRNVEYPYAVLCERNPEVIEFWDQPTTLKLTYELGDGRKASHLHTPDYLAIRKDRISFVECKRESELIHLAEKYPDRYSRSEDGTWRCPPGETAAAEYTLGYEIVSSNQLLPVLVRNCEFLADYYGAEPNTDLEPAYAAISAFFAERKQGSLRELLDHVGSVDAVYWALVEGRYFVDLERHLLSRPDAAKVYTDASYASFIEVCGTTQRQKPDTTSLVSLEPGVSLVWDGRPWKILNVGTNEIALSSESGALVSLAQTQIERLVWEGRIISHSTPKQDEILAQLQAADHAATEKALQRFRAIEPFLRQMNSSPDSRTYRDWLDRFRKAELRFGIGIIGLLDRPRPGNTTSRVESGVDELFARSVTERFATPVACTVRNAYVCFTDMCKEQRLRPFSYTAYRRRLKKLNRLKLIRARHGDKAAYQASGPTPSGEDGLPAHGDRVFEVAHIDHTLIEIVVVSAVTGEELGRLWLTLMIDSDSRMPLAHYLTFDPPSYRSVMMVIRECVRRHGRLPQKIVVDRGSEFESVYFETLLAGFRVTKLERPAASPRFGSPVERQFGSTQSTFIHSLIGNTQNRRLGRSASSSHDAGVLAVWTADALDERLTEWLYEIYPHLPHQGILEKPMERLKRSLAETGLRDHRLIAYNEAFRILTLPAPQQAMRKVHPSKGIHLHYFDYWSPGLAGAGGDAVEVRYDPFDPSYIYAFVNSKWIRCHCAHPLVKEYTEREIRFAAEELRQRARLTGRAYRLTPELLLAHLRTNHALEEQLRTERKLLRSRFESEENRVPEIRREFEPDESSETPEPAHDPEPEDAVPYPVTHH